jgi:hyperosmotically inducible protein
VTDAAADFWLTTQTRLKLIADSRVPALDVSVDARDGRVTLFGVVPSRAAKQFANEDAESVAGAGHVKNDLQIVPASQRAWVAARDGQIEQAVGDAIYKRPEMKRAAVKIEVRNGVVRLSGTVPSEQHRLFAATAARGVPGVRAVQQDVSVTRITEEPGAAPKPPA